MFDKRTVRSQYRPAHYVPFQVYFSLARYKSQAITLIVSIQPPYQMQFSSEMPVVSVI